MAKTGGRIGGDNRILSMREAAEYIDCHYQTLAANYRAWRIPVIRYNRLVKFRVRSLDEFLDRHEKRP